MFHGPYMEIPKSPENYHGTPKKFVVCIDVYH